MRVAGYEKEIVDGQYEPFSTVSGLVDFSSIRRSDDLLEIVRKYY